MTKLFHISGERGITRFEPRVPPSPDAGVTDEVVWAIDQDHLPNYLLPRDCPRVTFRASERTSHEDRKRFLADSATRRVIAVEANWLPRIRSCWLCLYEMPAESFALADAIAGYWIARCPVVPMEMCEISDPLAEIVKRGVELRLMPDLWPLHDAVVQSTLEFSIIRMRNARPRVSG